MTHALLALALILGGAAPALAQSDFGAAPSRYLKLDWTASSDGDRAVVWGHVFNDFGLPARDIQILVEGLDPAGRPVERAVGWVPYIVAPGTTGYFETRLPRVAAAYRVSVLSFSWADRDDLDFGIRHRFRR